MPQSKGSKGDGKERKGLWSHHVFQGHVPKGLLTSYQTLLLQALTNFLQYPKGVSDFRRLNNH